MQSFPQEKGPGPTTSSAQGENSLASNSFAVKAEEALQMLTVPTNLSQATFARAAEKWLEYKSFASPTGRARFVSARSLVDLKQYVRSLNRVFERLRLDAIHTGHIRQYQLMRAKGELAPEGWPRREISPNKINQEVNTLIRIMRFAGCWSEQMEELYQPLQHEESDVPRALTPQEQELWLRTSASRPPWRFIYWYSVVAFDCPLSTNELRGLRLGDIDLSNNLIVVRVRTSKNRYRTRTVPLSERARWAIDRILERAARAGSVAPQHYLMPFRFRQKLWLPDRAMTVSGLKRHWNEVRAASGLLWFRPYDTRHTSNTRYAEAGTPIAVMMDMTGHNSPKMWQHYTHISEQAKRKAVENVSVNHVAHLPPAHVVDAVANINVEKGLCHVTQV